MSILDEKELIKHLLQIRAKFEQDVLLKHQFVCELPKMVLKNLVTTFPLAH